MLEHLQISNYALIEDVHIDFTSGFTVLSGETGAGKSIILGAIGLLTGEKCDATVVRTGEKEAVISAELYISDNDPVNEWLKERELETDDGILTLRRVVKDNGRNHIYIQGQTVTRQELESLGSFLFDISGQHEHQSLVSPDKQRRVLDDFGHLDDVRERYGMAYKEHERLTKELQQLEAMIAAGARETDYLSYACNEIEKAKLQEGEDDNLAAELARASHAEILHENMELAAGLLKGDAGGQGVLPALHDVVAALARSSHVDSSLQELAQRLESLRLEAEDIRETLKERMATLFFSPEELDSLQARQAEIQRLKKKYGPSLSEVLIFARNAREKLELAVSGEDKREELRARMQEQDELVQKRADELSAARGASALELGREIEFLLHLLGMKDAIFPIEVHKGNRRLSGQDDVEFLFSANKGEIPRPLKSIASGGELSRVMLALKTVLAQADSVDTLVFDEIDAGIGGAVAHAVGEQLQRLAEHRQVLVITHLATIAARAHIQFVVAKKTVGERTRTEIFPCTGEPRIQEIARMLSGEDTPISREHARLLLEESGVNPMQSSTHS
ncbi:DNA repair protein RecN [Parasphaerochaeta coccoides]|uniref:DNA repair protein RecN n=1 Tax=Parasphaerochaeta coccoides (strain ATCC BAA-1237 / DSM 17374 / SPN1) TaxID=760011 RepID=F4GKX5_PARC1|nr:DNA repair protein RecN [Parasphaerochaeta coccoides]AEC01888.1 DNA repair protein RecN [Parasphaerochaeta coccoides DSM 17374]